MDDVIQPFPSFSEAFLSTVLELRAHCTTAVSARVATTTPLSITDITTVYAPGAE